MEYLTILNTIAIIIIFYTLHPIKIKIKRIETFRQNTLTGYYIIINDSYFKIPIKNHKKTEKKEEIHRMTFEYSPQQKIQSLTAKFSWLKKWEDVNQFEKDYSVVDKKTVRDLVNNFAINNAFPSISPTSSDNQH